MVTSWSESANALDEQKINAIAMMDWILDVMRIFFHIDGYDLVDYISSNLETLNQILSIAIIRLGVNQAAKLFNQPKEDSICVV